MEPLIHLSYVYDKSKLLAIAAEAKADASPYTDPRYPNYSFQSWLMGHYTNDYIENIMKEFDIKGKPRFYYLEPNTQIPTHVDRNTTCSINFILTDEPAPVTILGRDYYYDCALLNTTVPHSVKNKDKQRILFKISIFEESFESLANRIKFKK